MTIGICYAKLRNMNKIRQEERRKFLRLRAYHLAKYKLLVAREAHLHFTLASIKDLSGGGICLRTKEKVPVPSMIELQIKFPSLDTPIYTVAKVLWVKQIKRHKIYEIGTQFVEIEESMRRIIDSQAKFVEERVKKAKAEKNKISIVGRLFFWRKK